MKEFERISKNFKYSSLKGYEGYDLLNIKSLW